ncbi:MAG: DUF4124 domain-containing protein [Lautropia sp.]|nr:DUF4124 domain-containing protein [Lautropia sp.]
MSLARFLSFLPTLLLAPAAGNQSVVVAQPATSSIYVCTDERGRVISSDQPIAVCAKREMRELNSDGSLRRLVPPPLTRAQERAAAQQALIKQEQERVLRAQQARDRHLLLTYQSPEDLDRRHKQHLDRIDGEIEAAIQRILVLDKSLQEEKAAAQVWLAEQKRPNAKLPYAREHRISSIANAILAEDSLIKERRGERERINKDFQANAQRLKELLAHIASTPESGH